MAKSVAGKRPRLVRVSEEMRHICALLAQELLRWPDVSARSMFGLRAFYRGAVVFAMLPDKRALESPKAIAYKLPDGTQRREGEKWQLCELKNEHDIGNALACLDKAYTRAIEAEAVKIQTCSHAVRAVRISLRSGARVDESYLSPETYVTRTRMPYP